MPSTPIQQREEWEKQLDDIIDLHINGETTRKEIREDAVLFIKEVIQRTREEVLNDMLAIDKKRRLNAESHNHLYSNIATEAINEYAKSKGITLTPLSTEPVQE